MVEKTDSQSSFQEIVTIDEVNRVLEIGRLLFSVLTPEEIELMPQVLSNWEAFQEFACKKETETGNTSVT